MQLTVYYAVATHNFVSLHFPRSLVQAAARQARWDKTKSDAKEEMLRLRGLAASTATRMEDITLQHGRSQYAATPAEVAANAKVGHRLAILTAVFTSIHQNPRLPLSSAFEAAADLWHVEHDRQRNAHKKALIAVQCASRGVSAPSTMASATEYAKRLYTHWMKSGNLRRSMYSRKSVLKEILGDKHTRDSITNWVDHRILKARLGANPPVAPVDPGVLLGGGRC